MSKRYLQVIQAVVLFIMLAVPFKAVSDDTYPPYVVLVSRDAVDSDFQMSDSAFYAMSAATVFPVNKWGLNLSDPIVRELADDVLPRLVSNGYELAAINLRGAASPEGPYNWNVTLSKNRARTLTDFLISQLGQEYEPTMLSTELEAEDYTCLVLALESANDPSADLVRTIVERGYGNPALTKRMLKRAEGGRLWPRLLREYFPALRAARVVLFFRTTNEREPMRVAAIVIESEPDPMRVSVPQTLTPLNWRPTEIPRYHLLSVGTNLAYDAFWMPHFGMAPMPNVAVELFPSPECKWTFRAEFMWPYYHKWDKNKFFQIRDYHLEVRRYFNPGRWHSGWFLGAYVNATKYGIGLSKSKGWQGEGAGAALKGGYIVRLGEGRWRLEFAIAAGAWITRYDPYVYGNPVTGTEDGDYYYDYTGASSAFKKRNHQFFWFGPTEFSITLSYDLLFRRSTGGVSTRSTEKGVMEPWL